MTSIFRDPAGFAEDQLTGFTALYADRLRQVPGGVVSHLTDRPQVGVVVGGGSGHYPAFAGTVGPGLATGAVVGNIFTSPSTAQAYSVARAADQGEGIIFSFGNYAGDNMNFGLAADRLRKEGIDTRIVVVTDDIASADEPEKRRGIAGDFSVFKVLGAAAAEGMSLEDVERVGQAANANTRTLGVAFSGCTMPGATEPLFTVPDGHLGLGLGIHGEPGIRDVAMLPADELAALLVDDLLRSTPDGAGSRVAPILNGLGTTKYEELFLLWSLISKRLQDNGLELVEPEVGELVTSLDMGGCSLTLMWLDEELERLWRADAYTPAYRKVRSGVDQLHAPSDADESAASIEMPAPDATDAARQLGVRLRKALGVMQRTLTEHEDELARIDAVAGDGDHGRGMVKGCTAATRAVERAPAESGVGHLFSRAGQAWAEQAGGTSGVLWGSGLEAFGDALTDSRESYTAADIAAGVRAFTDAVRDLGHAELGDKTMLDALIPFSEQLSARVEDGLPIAWTAAAERARRAADGTATLRPRVGRARPLAEKSIGHPDAGATSLALIVTALGAWLPETTNPKEGDK
ncbi:dihydroxyacetone kinase family protein [Flexivirga meconopsidis]|uniref:dihydroxyacetone kinase family protein n=1 Tax=Flexivirga meconopsidis TaxID=2977121 RepID=UPI00223ECE43|nr:dihydroxyacetone kinase family protein [Flexivirga meconopsidis]